MNKIIDWVSNVSKNKLNAESHFYEIIHYILCSFTQPRKGCSHRADECSMFFKYIKSSLPRHLRETHQIDDWKKLLSCDQMYSRLKTSTELVKLAKKSAQWWSVESKFI